MSGQMISGEGKTTDVTLRREAASDLESQVAIRDSDAADTGK